MVNRLRLWLRALFRRTEMERELDEELRFHLEKEIEQNLKRGMSTEEARLAALRSFGGVERVKEESRDVRGVRYVEELWQDLRYGARMLAKTPWLHAWWPFSRWRSALARTRRSLRWSMRSLLRPLPYPGSGAAGGGRHDNAPRARSKCAATSYPDFVDWRDQNTVFEQIAARFSTSFSLLGASEPERVSGELVSASYFSLLGVRAAYGRTFLPEEDRTPDTHRVAVVGYGFWQRRFGGNPQSGRPDDSTE